MTTLLDAHVVDAQPDTAPEEDCLQTAHSDPAAPAPADGTGFSEAGLRELTGHDWLAAAAWGVAGAVATSAVSVLFLPLHLIALTFVLGAGLGMLGYLDHCTQLIRNTHTLVFGTAAALLLTATQILSPAGAVLIPALVAATVTFVFMLGLAVSTNFAGGGDIKLSPVPAALLAAVSPIAAMLWLLFTFVLCLGAMIAARLSGSTRKHVAMAPFMAIAAVLAIGVYGLISRALGI